MLKKILNSIKEKLRSVLYTKKWYYFRDRKKELDEMQKKGQIVPTIMWIPIFLTLACNTAAYFGTRLLTADRVHHNLSSTLDQQIPFVPWTVTIYLGCYVFWIVNYVIGCRQEKEEAFRFMCADVYAKLICMICFVVFPTTNTRPVIEGTSIWEEAMRFLYSIDAADNLFPSIHCLTSWFCFIAVRKNEKIPKWYQILSFLIAVSICISTLTTKQHVPVDVIAGILLAEVSYYRVGKNGFAKRYMDVISQAGSRLSGRGKLCG